MAKRAFGTIVPMDPSPSGFGVLWAGRDYPAPLPADPNDYAYSHGGPLYRAACEAMWAGKRGKILLKPSPTR